MTPQGERDAFVAGELMTGRICRLLHSPVERCLQTAEQLRAGSGLKSVPQEWMGLRCDAYVTDHNSALDTLTRLVSEDGFYDEFIREMATSGDKIPYPHFKSPLIGTVNMIGHMVASGSSGLCVGVTHDWLVNVAASYVTGIPVARPAYADFLDTLFVWREKKRWMYYYKGVTGRCPSFFESIPDS